MEKRRGELKRKEEFSLIEAHLPVQAQPEDPQKSSISRKDLTQPPEQTKLDRRHISAESI